MSGNTMVGEKARQAESTKGFATEVLKMHNPTLATLASRAVDYTVRTLSEAVGIHMVFPDKNSVMPASWVKEVLKRFLPDRIVYENVNAPTNTVDLENVEYPMTRGLLVALGINEVLPFPLVGGMASEEPADSEDYNQAWGRVYVNALRQEEKPNLLVASLVAIWTSEDNSRYVDEHERLTAQELDILLAVSIVHGVLGFDSPTHIGFAEVSDDQKQQVALAYRQKLKERFPEFEEIYTRIAFGESVNSLDEDIRWNLLATRFKYYTAMAKYMAVLACLNMSTGIGQENRRHLEQLEKEAEAIFANNNFLPSTAKVRNLPFAFRQEQE